MNRNMDYITLILYFLAGVIQDFFFTLNSKYIAKEKVLMAVLFSFLTILMSMLVLYNILNDLDSSRSLLSIIVYSVGIACGTYIAMKIPSSKNKKRIK